MSIAGIYSWLCIWFIPTKTIAMIGLIISGCASLLILRPMVVLLWSEKVATHSIATKTPLWLLRYLSPLALLFLVWYPLYFFTSMSLPSLYTAFNGNQSTIKLSASSMYSTSQNSVRKKEKFWLEFYGYYGSIRVDRSLFESFAANPDHEASVLKGYMGIYILSIN